MRLLARSVTILSSFRPVPDQWRWLGTCRTCVTLMVLMYTRMGRFIRDLNSEIK